MVLWFWGLGFRWGIGSSGIELGVQGLVGALSLTLVVFFRAGLCFNHCFLTRFWIADSLTPKPLNSSFYFLFRYHCISPLSAPNPKPYNKGVGQAGWVYTWEL